MKNIILDNIDTSVRLQSYPEYTPNESAIIEFERSLGCDLPNDYKYFLQNYNGGVCELKNVIQPVSGYLCDLYGLYPNNDEGLFLKLRLPGDEYYKEIWGELPDHLLPIGEVDSGDMIALKFSGNNSELVVIDHESEDFDVLLSQPNFMTFLLQTVREPD